MPRQKLDKTVMYVVGGVNYPDRSAALVATADKDLMTMLVNAVASDELEVALSTFERNVADWMFANAKPLRTLLDTYIKNSPTPEQPNEQS